MAQTTYRVKRNGREYVYSYDRTKYSNNTEEYNKHYWADHKDELKKRAKLRRIERNISKISDVSKVGKLIKDAEGDKVPGTQD